MKDVYLVAIERDMPVAHHLLRAAFEEEEGAVFQPGTDGSGFTLEVDGSRVEVHFEAQPMPADWNPDVRC